MKSRFGRIEDALGKARELAQRKTTILKTIDEQGFVDRSIAWTN